MDSKYRYHKSHAPVYAGGGYTPINEAPQKLQYRGVKVWSYSCGFSIASDWDTSPEMWVSTQK